MKENPYKEYYPINEEKEVTPFSRFVNDKRLWISIFTLALCYYLFVHVLTAQVMYIYNDKQYEFKRCLVWSSYTYNGKEHKIKLKADNYNIINLSDYDVMVYDKSKKELNDQLIDETYTTSPIFKGVAESHTLLPDSSVRPVNFDHYIGGLLCEQDDLPWHERIKCGQLASVKSKPIPVFNRGDKFRGIRVGYVISPQVMADLNTMLIVVTVVCQNQVLRCYSLGDFDYNGKTYKTQIEKEYVINDKSDALYVWPEIYINEETPFKPTPFFVLESTLKEKTPFVINDGECKEVERICYHFCELPEKANFMDNSSFESYWAINFLTNSEVKERYNLFNQFTKTHLKQ